MTDAGEAAAGVLYVVATPIGNLEDISYRAVRVLGEVEVIAAEDTRAARRLLAHYEIAAPRVVSLFEGNEAARTEELCAALAAGRSVAVVSEAGTPGISDPGERLVARAVAAGIRVEVVPGPSAAIAALVGSGLSTARFAFLGFPPRAAGARRALLGGLRGEVATLVLYESPRRLAATLADLVAAFGDDRPAVVARELTKRHEEYARGALGELAARFAEAPARGECTLVVRGADVRDANRLAPAAGDAGRDRDHDRVERAVRALLADGLGPRDVAARLVVKTGLPRRQLYQLALSVARERPPAAPSSAPEPPDDDPR